MLIETPAGHVPVSMVARIIETSGPNQVLRENNQRRIVVTANGDGSNNNLIVARNRPDDDASSRVPTGYFMTFEGVYAEQTRSTLRLGGLALDLADAGLRHPFHALPVAGVRPDDHGQRAARADRQRDRDQGRRRRSLDRDA